MSEPPGRGRPEVEVPSRYRVHLLPDPKPTERGIVYRRGSDRLLLEWGRVQRALAARIGGDGGPVVFDLAIETRGRECVVCRVDAEPGEAAQALARSIVLGVGPARCAGGLRDAAADGRPQRAYSDLESFQEANLEALRFG